VETAVPDTWVIAAAAALPLALGLYRLARRPKRDPVAEPAATGDEREERLARRVAREVGCTPAQALPAVRREIGLAPHQPDATILKRATYHYRRELPERACAAYRDRAAG
jgi:hypothetical protein